MVEGIVAEGLAAVSGAFPAQEKTGNRGGQRGTGRRRKVVVAHEHRTPSAALFCADNPQAFGSHRSRLGGFDSELSTFAVPPLERVGEQP